MRCRDGLCTDIDVRFSQVVVHEAEKPSLVQKASKDLASAAVLSLGQPGPRQWAEVQP